MKEKIEYGFCNVHIAIRKEIINEQGEKEISYEPPFPIPNAKSTNFTPQGESTPVPADNKIILTLTSNQGYQGDFVFTSFPTEVYTKLLGFMKDADGSLLEPTNSSEVAFALLFQIENDVKARRFVFYNCAITKRPDITSKTIETTPTPEERTLSIAARPDDEVLKGYSIVKKMTTDETTDSVYNNWFKAVTLPQMPAPVTPSV